MDVNSLIRIFCRVACFLALFQVAAAAVQEPVVTMEAVQVRAEPIEEFGFRVSPDFDHVRSTQRNKLFIPVVDVILPNTAASKAGLRPGDRIVGSDGLYVGDSSRKLSSWSKAQQAKWAKILQGSDRIEWRLSLERPGQDAHVEVLLVLPTQAPKWGVGKWTVSKERESLRIREPGVLAERAEDVMRCGIWTLLRSSYVSGFALPYNDGNPAFLGYQWTIWDRGVGHRMFVSNQRGKIDIVLEVIYKSAAVPELMGSPGAQPDKSLLSAATVHAIDSMAFLTSVDSKLIKAWRIPPDNRQGEVMYDQAQACYLAELEFWTTRVARVQGLWPLGLK